MVSRSPLVRPPSATLSAWLLRLHGLAGRRVGECEPVLQLDEPSRVGGVELGSHDGAGDDDAGCRQQPPEQRDRDPEQAEVGGRTIHHPRHVDGRADGEDRHADRGGAPCGEQATPVHLPLEQEVGDARPQHEADTGLERDRPEPLEREPTGQLTDQVGQADHHGEGDQPESGVHRAAQAGLGPSPRGAVHRLEPATERHRGVDQQQRAEHRHAAGRPGGGEEQLLHGVGRGARQVEPPDDGPTDHVLLPGRSGAGHDDEERDQRGQGLGREHDAAVEPLHEGEAPHGLAEERRGDPARQGADLVRALLREQAHQLTPGGLRPSVPARAITCPPSSPPRPASARVLTTSCSVASMPLSSSGVGEANGPLANQGARGTTRRGGRHGGRAWRKSASPS